MEYLVGFNYSGRVTYEIEADDEETAKREAANRWSVWVSADAVGHNPEFACAGIKYDTMTAERLIDGDVAEVNENEWKRFKQPSSLHGDDKGRKKTGV